ncbi:MAG: hypothetical protein ACK46X_06285, partial [Candidatus Sericytochromatia bacterium]
MQIREGGAAAEAARRAAAAEAARKAAAEAAAKQAAEEAAKKLSEGLKGLFGASKDGAMLGSTKGSSKLSLDGGPAKAPGTGAKGEDEQVVDESLDSGATATSKTKDAAEAPKAIRELAREARAIQ